jgi:hypothetical protein
MRWGLRRRGKEEQRLAEREEFRQLRRVIVEDVTVFGEQLVGLHVETLTTELDTAMRDDYQRALDRYEDAKSALSAAEDAAAVSAIEPLLNDGRFHLACVLARRDGEPLPERREPCFFNPQHGPGVADVSWAPREGVPRMIPVCGADARRLEQGIDPDVRLIRVGDRYVRWYEAEAARGLLVATFGSEAVRDVPKYVMLEADLNRMQNQFGSGLFP